MNILVLGVVTALVVLGLLCKALSYPPERSLNESHERSLILVSDNQLQNIYYRKDLLRLVGGVNIKEVVLNKNDAEDKHALKSIVKRNDMVLFNYQYLDLTKLVKLIFQLDLVAAIYVAMVS